MSQVPTENEGLRDRVQSLENTLKTAKIVAATLAAGLCGTLGHICQQRGYQLADITLLQPIGFLSLIWNTLLGFFLFFQTPDAWTFVGAAVIFGSAMYISHREAVRRAQIKSGGPTHP